MTAIQKISTAKSSTIQETPPEPSLFSPLEQVDGYAAKAALAALIILDKASFISPIRWFLPTATEDGKSLKFVGAYGCGGDQLRTVPQKAEDAGGSNVPVANLSSSDAGQQEDGGVVTLVDQEDAGMMVPMGAGASGVDAGSPPIVNVPQIEEYFVADGYSPSLVWTGTGYGMVWRDLNGIYFGKFDPRGNQIGGTIPISSNVSHVTGSSMVWDGNSYDIFWSRLVGNYGSPPYYTPRTELYFAKLDSSGAIIETKFIGNFGADHCYFRVFKNQALTWSGSQFALVTTNVYDHKAYYLSLFDEHGNTIADEVAIPDGPDFSGNSIQLSPSVVWNGQEYGISYTFQNGNAYFTRFDSRGHKIGNSVLVNTGGTLFSDLAWSGTEYGLAFGKSSSVYFRRLAANGLQIGNDTIVGSDPSSPLSRYSLSLIWANGEYGLSWAGGHLGTKVYFSRIDSIGNKVESDLLVSNYSQSTSFLTSVSIVWTGREYGLSRDDFRWGVGTKIYFDRIIGDFSHP